MDKPYKIETKTVVTFRYVDVEGSDGVMIRKKFKIKKNLTRKVPIEDKNPIIKNVNPKTNNSNIISNQKANHHASPITPKSTKRTHSEVTFLKKTISPLLSHEGINIKKISSSKFPSISKKVKTEIAPPPIRHSPKQNGNQTTLQPQKKKEQTSNVIHILPSKKSQPQRENLYAVPKKIYYVTDAIHLQISVTNTLDLLRSLGMNSSSIRIIADQCDEIKMAQCSHSITVEKECEMLKEILKKLNKRLSSKKISE